MLCGVRISPTFALQMVLFTFTASWIYIPVKSSFGHFPILLKYPISTTNKAKASRDTDMPLIIHTDRGCLYASEAWHKATEGMTRSYFHTGYPYDNTCIESFHSLIKRKWLNRFTIRNYRHAYSLVFEYIETFYNTVRIHSHCDYLSPNDYEKLYMRVENLPAA